MLARRPSYVLDNLLSRFLQWSGLLSHLRSYERYDEPETLPYSIRPFCPMSADGGHGHHVADIVHACSDSVTNTSGGEPKEDWRIRKRRYLQHLRLVDEDALWVSLADKVHNARSILCDLRKREIGPKVFDRFRAPEEDTLWYYGELAKVFKDRLPRQQLADELSAIVDALRNDISEF
jgi:hypothetical protein